MRKPNPNINPELGFSDDLLWAHHIVETVSDTLMGVLDEADDFDGPIDTENTSPQEMLNTGMSVNTLITYTSLMGVEVIHEAIHDMMGAEGRLRVEDIEDHGFRKAVRDHVPRIMKSSEMDQATKDEVNRVLGRKV